MCEATAAICAEAAVSVCECVCECVCVCVDGDTMYIQAALYRSIYIPRTHH